MRYLLTILSLLFLFSCQEPENVYGCTADTACNFNPDANVFDDSCIYLEDKLLEGYCSCDDEVLDCADECGGDTAPEDCITEIKGYVYNNSGEPLENTAIFLTYEFVPLGRPSTSLNISIPEASLISVWITDFCGNVVSNLVDNEMYDAGSYNIDWDATDNTGNLVVAGEYSWHLEAGSYYGELKMFFSGTNYGDLESIEGYNYHGLTDEAGYFSVPIDCLSFGVTQTMTDEMGNETGGYTVSYSIKLSAFNEENGFYETDFYEVNPEEDLNIEITLP
tara:strand:+ start:241 stop:1074 length:834 start_codon:yes stop_codon:yes gene_type:complete